MQIVLTLLDRINSFLAYKLGWDMTISCLVVLSLMVFLMAEFLVSSGKIAVVVFWVAVAGMLIWPEDKNENEESEEKDERRSKKS